MRTRAASILALALVLASCASSPAQAPPKAATRDYFDERTGSTWSVVDEPLIFARERTDVAAFARDYATLVAIEVDLSGKDSDYLLLYRWSTVDPRFSPPPRPDRGELRILADGRSIDLRPLPELPVSLSRRRPLHLPPHGEVVPYAYRVDLSLLRFIAGSRQLRLRMPQESLDLPFLLWKDGRDALARFAGPERAGGAGAAQPPP